MYHNSGVTWILICRNILKTSIRKSDNIRKHFSSIKIWFCCSHQMKCTSFQWYITLYFCLCNSSEFYFKKCQILHFDMWWKLFWAYWEHIKINVSGPWESKYIMCYVQPLTEALRLQFWSPENTAATNVFKIWWLQSQIHLICSMNPIPSLNHIVVVNNFLQYDHSFLRGLNSHLKKFTVDAHYFDRGYNTRKKRSLK